MTTIRDHRPSDITEQAARIPQAAGSQPGFVGAHQHADICVIVVTFNNRDDITDLLCSLRLQAGEHRVRVVVTDNGSQDGTVQRLRAEPDVMVIAAPGNLGYAGGINLASRHIGSCDHILILNPDLVLEPHAVSALLGRMRTPGAGVAVPRILNSDRTTYRSLRHEPSITRALGDAVLGAKVSNRPAWSTETEYSAASYRWPHRVDWASGAALLIRREVADQVGAWNEEFFLYSEETDYLRRVRRAGFDVWFEPTSIVVHRGSGSGTSPGLAALMAVNRVRYAESSMDTGSAAVFRAAVAFSEAVRSYDPHHRRILRYVVNRRRWSELPSATYSSWALDAEAPRRGSVIIPACNEESVIVRTLTPLSSAATLGIVEVVVVCNGCTDRTAAMARSVEGITVVEIDQASKIAALNAGDRHATLWPRMYLDADIGVSAQTVLGVLDRLTVGDVLAARPVARMNADGASILVRSYYRARARLPQLHSSLWGGGCYAVNSVGHQRFDHFPSVVGDDLFVDSSFASDEKLIVAVDPVVVRTPRRPRDLHAVLRRTYRGNAQLLSLADRPGSEAAAGATTRGTVGQLIRSVRGPGSAFDAVVYAGFAVWGRVAQRPTGPPQWERDNSSRR